jgi:hypothetical protein
MDGGTIVRILGIGLGGLWLIGAEVGRYRGAKLQVELKMKLIEKFGSSQELLAYIETDAGKQFMRSIVGAAPAATDVYKPVIGAFWWSILFAVMGGALLFLRGRIPDAGDGLEIIGTLAVALGVGVAVSTTVACLLLKWWKQPDSPTNTRQ